MDWLDSFTVFLADSGVWSNLNQPASCESIIQIERVLGEQDRIRGFKVPPSYQSFLLRWDGGSVNDEGAGSYIHFLSVAADKVNRCSLMDYNGAGTVLMNHEIDTYFSFEPLVMFAMDEGSSFWAFDPRHRRADGEMPIRYCDHETGDIYTQAEDFSSFILALSEHKLEDRGLENSL